MNKRGILTIGIVVLLAPLFDYRRYLLNGIIWTAKIDVPAEGVAAPAPPEL